MPNSSLRIIPMELQHLDEVAKIEKDIFSTPWPKTLFERELKRKDSYYVVCLGDEKVKGYGGFNWFEDEANITTLVVDYGFRRHGIGGKIMSSMLRRARELKVNSVFLEVRMSNIEARRLYTKFSFYPIGIRRRYYTDNGEDALLMRLDI